MYHALRPSGHASERGGPLVVRDTPSTVISTHRIPLGTKVEGTNIKLYLC
jgi:hypothetical protein